MLGGNGGDHICLIFQTCRSPCGSYTDDIFKANAVIGSCDVAWFSTTLGSMSRTDTWTRVNNTRLNTHSEVVDYHSNIIPFSRLVKGKSKDQARKVRRHSEGTVTFVVIIKLRSLLIRILSWMILQNMKTCVAGPRAVEEWNRTLSLAYTPTITASQVPFKVVKCPPIMVEVWLSTCNKFS